MNNYQKGDYVISLRGRDTGKIYIISAINSDTVYLVDGKGKTIDKPKQKNYRHIKALNQTCEVLAQKFNNNKQVLDPEVRKWIRNLQIKED